MTYPADLPDTGELRRLVREVLRELIPLAAGPRGPGNVMDVASGQSGVVERHIQPIGSAGGAAGGGTVRAVRLTTDEELHAFVAEVLRLADDPRRRQDLLAGRLRFTLGNRAPGAGPPAGEPRAGIPAAVRRIEKGAVTERAVIAAAKAGDRLVLGPGAMLTPLAKDKARALGVPVEKER